MREFSSKTTAEILPLSWDLEHVVDDLPSGEALSTASVAATVLSGTDATPSAIVSGSASVSGTTVTQKIIAGTAGVTYRLRCTAITAPGAYKIEEDASLEVTA